MYLVGFHVKHDVLADELVDLVEVFLRLRRVR